MLIRNTSHYMRGNWVGTRSERSVRDRANPRWGGGISVTRPKYLARALRYCVPRAGRPAISSRNQTARSPGLACADRPGTWVLLLSGLGQGLCARLV